MKDGILPQVLGHWIYYIGWRQGHPLLAPDYEAGNYKEYHLILQDMIGWCQIETLASHAVAGFVGQQGKLESYTIKIQTNRRFEVAFLHLHTV